MSGRYAVRCLPFLRFGTWPSSRFYLTPRLFWCVRLKSETSRPIRNGWETADYPVTCVYIFYITLLLYKNFWLAIPGILHKRSTSCRIWPSAQGGYWQWTLDERSSLITVIIGRLAKTKMFVVHCTPAVLVYWPSPPASQPFRHYHKIYTLTFDKAHDYNYPLKILPL